MKPLALLRGLSAALALTVTAPAQAEPPRVIATIKPIHSLVAGVMLGAGEPELLLQGTSSPHSYAMKPSDAASLGRAQIVFWVGDVLESFLVKPLQAQASGARVIELMDAPGVILLRNREGVAHDGHQHGDERKSKARRNTQGRQDHTEYDPHLWLDPENAKAIVISVRDALTSADPDNAEIYRSNATRMQDELSQLDRELRTALQGIREVPYVVFHDGYQYFEKRYGLAAAGAVTLSPERQPGARRVQEIRARIATQKVRCGFSEPQFEPQLIRTVTEGLTVKTATLDPIGADIAPGPEAYAALLRRLATSLNACLSGTT